jgi:hypothetical protein
MNRHGKTDKVVVDAPLVAKPMLYEVISVFSVRTIAFV